jgi:hypothetical protein
VTDDGREMWLRTEVNGEVTDTSAAPLGAARTVAGVQTDPNESVVAPTTRDGVRPRLHSLIVARIVRTQYPIRVTHPRA